MSNKVLDKQFRLKLVIRSICQEDASETDVSQSKQTIIQNDGTTNTIKRAIRKKLETKQQPTPNVTYNPNKLKRKVGYNFDNQLEVETTGKQLNQMDLSDGMEL